MSIQQGSGQDPQESDQIDHVNPMDAERGYVKIPRWIEQMRRSEEITEAERKILYEVANETESWDRPWVKFTNAELAERVGVSERWVVECVKRLLEQSLLQRREHGKTYVYGLGDPNEPSREEIREIVQGQLN